MKTAVTQVLEYFAQFELTITEENKAKFLETEKQQIIEAHSAGVWDCKSHETYYTETFNQ